MKLVKKFFDIILCGVLALIIYYCYDIHSIKEMITVEKMFIMSVGLSTIIIFITNSLEKKNEGVDNKEKFYLGYNAKNIYYMKNFWLSQYINFHVKLIFWINIIMPTIVLCMKMNYKYISLNKIFSCFKLNEEIFILTWLVTFIVSSLYCIAIFIESVEFTKINFSQSYIYREPLTYEKDMIELEIKEFYKDEFNKIFKNRIFKQENKIKDFQVLIESIIIKSRELSDSHDNIIKYCKLVFKIENDLINGIIKELDGRKDKYSKRNKFRKILKNFRLYYKIKWEKLKESEILPVVLIKCAVNDLTILKQLEKLEDKYKDNEEYKYIFRIPLDITDIHKNASNPSNNESIGNHVTPNQQGTNAPKNHSNSTIQQCNYNTSIQQIYNILNEIIEKESFYSSIDTIDDIIDLFKVLNSIDEQENKHFKQIFKKIFKKSINKKEKDIAFFDKFMEYLNSDEKLEVYIRDERNINCKNLIISSYLPTNKQLKYMLNHLQFEDIVSALFYRIINKDRGIINYKEYYSWKNSIVHKSDGKDLKDFNYKNFLKEKIKNSSNNLCSYGKFIDWTLETLYSEFNDEHYKEFNEYNYNIPNYNINLSNYIVLKLLLCNNTPIISNVRNKLAKEEIEKELKKINFVNEEMFLCGFQKYDKNKVSIKQKRISKYRALLIKNKL